MVADLGEVEVEIGGGAGRKTSAPGMWEGKRRWEVRRYLGSGLGQWEGGKAGDIVV